MRAEKKKIITLCGSIQFEDYFRIVNAELTLRGWVVLAPGIFKHEFLHNSKYRAQDAKTGLDQLHRRKIRMSEAIFVVDILGYVGSSTVDEISYALDQGKMVYKWSRGDLAKLM